MSNVNPMFVMQKERNISSRDLEILQFFRNDNRKNDA